MIPTIWHSGKGKTMELVNGSMVATGGVWKEMKRPSTEDLGGSETLLYHTAVVYPCHYTFAQTHRIYTSKGEP